MRKTFNSWNKNLFLFLQAKDCLLKTIGEDAKRLVSFTRFYTYIMRDIKLVLKNPVISFSQPYSNALALNLAWSQGGEHGEPFLAYLTTLSPSMNMSSLLHSKAFLKSLNSQRCGLKNYMLAGCSPGLLDSAGKTTLCTWKLQRQP